MARRRRYNRKRRKGNFAFLYKLLAFVLICGAIGLALAMFFRIDDIEISGNSRYSNEQIAAAAQIKAGDNLFFLNKYDAAARIRQQLPYVETVQFRRVLPSKLVVQITECRDPVAIKQDGTVYLLLRKLKADGLVTTYLQEASVGPPRGYRQRCQMEPVHPDRGADAAESPGRQRSTGLRHAAGRAGPAAEHAGAAGR